MNPSNPISSGLREVFTAFKRMLDPTPEAELGLMRHEPLDADSDTAFWSDAVYLHDLRHAITDEIRSGAFVFEVPPPVLSEKRLAELRRELDAEVWAFANIFEGAAR